MSLVPTPTTPRPVLRPFAPEAPPAVHDAITTAIWGMPIADMFA